MRNMTLKLKLALLLLSFFVMSLATAATPASHQAYAYLTTINDGANSALVSVNAKTLQVGTPLTNLFNFNDFCSVAVSPDGNKVYVVDGANQMLRVVSGGSNPAFLGGLDISFAGSPAFVIANPNGKTLYLSDAYLQNVYVIDVQNPNPKLVTVIKNVSHVDAISVSPDGSRIYIMGSTDGTRNENMYVVDANTNQVIKTIALGFDKNSLSTAMVISPDGLKVYAEGQQNDQFTVAVVDTTTDKVINYVALAQDAFTLAISPDGSTVYAGGAYGQGLDVVMAISKIDTMTGAVTFIYPKTLGQLIPGGIMGMSISPDGSHLFFMNLGSNNLYVMPVQRDVVTNVNIGNQVLDQNGNFIG